MGFLGLLVGVLVLRTSGHYLALASIAVAVIIQVLIKNSTVTGGPSGLTAIPSPDIFGFRITDDLMYCYYALICMIVGFVILRRIITSRTGDALQAIANNKLAAQSLGIPVFRYKVMSFTISTLFAAFAGTLFTHYDGFINPDRLGIPVSVFFDHGLCRRHRKSLRFHSWRLRPDDRRRILPRVRPIQRISLWAHAGYRHSVPSQRTGGLAEQTQIAQGEESHAVSQ